MKREIMVSRKMSIGGMEINIMETKKPDKIPPGYLTPVDMR